MSINIRSHCVIIGADIVAAAEAPFSLGLGAALPPAFHPLAYSSDGPTSKKLISLLSLPGGKLTPTGDASPSMLAQEFLLELIVLVVIFRLGKGCEKIIVEDDEAFVFLGLGLGLFSWVNVIIAGHEVIFCNVQLNPSSDIEIPLRIRYGSGDGIDMIDAGSKVAHGVGQYLGHGRAMLINGSIEMGQSGLSLGWQHVYRCIWLFGFEGRMHK